MSIKLYENIENSFKEDNDMIILAKSNTLSIIVKQSNAEKFIDDMNKNKISDEFLQECMQSAHIFKRSRQECI